MNRTSSFGKIHTFNPKFINEYKKKFNLNSVEEAKIKFSKDIDTLKKQVIKSSHKIEDFKLIIYDGESKQKKGYKNKLTTDFIYDYFSNEDSELDIEENRGLVYYEIDHNLDKIKDFDLSPLRKKVKIKQAVQDFHNDTINLIDTHKKSTEDYRAYDENIPMQIYLLNFKNKDGIEEHHSLMIFAENESENGDKSRVLSGVHSQEEKLYMLFETIYNYTYKKLI